MSSIESAPSARPAPPARSTTLIVRPWIDPLVDSIGHPPDGRYVELFWLGILGPTTTWLVRRMASGLDVYPDGYELDLAETAAALGLSLVPGRHGPFTRALERSVLFGVAHHTVEQSGPGLALRRRIPPLAARQVDRLPGHLRVAHREWCRSTGDTAERTWHRATRLAAAFLDAGDEPDTVERHLATVCVPPPLCRPALDAARSSQHYSVSGDRAI